VNTYNIRSSEEFAEEFKIGEQFAEDLLRDFGLRIVFLQVGRQMQDFIHYY
jgi:hypothetical protein